MDTDHPYKLLIAIFIVMLVIVGITDLFIPEPANSLKFDYEEFK